MESCGAVRDWELTEGLLTVTFEHGRARVQRPVPGVWRVLFAIAGELPGGTSWAVPVPRQETISVSERGGHLVVETGGAALSIDLASGAVTAREGGAAFGDDTVPVSWRPLTLAETDIEARPGEALPPAMARALTLSKRLGRNDGIYGLGLRAAPLDRRHRRVTNWNVDTSIPGHCRGHDNTYQSHPFALVARPGQAWGLLIDHPGYSEFDGGARRTDSLAATVLGDRIDCYLLAGPTPAQVVERLTALTGRPLLPPLWALGFHQSRWSYPSDADVQRIAAEFRARRIPLDALHLDIDYMDGARVFTWDRQRFPRPDTTIAALREQGIRTVAILDPGIKDEPAFAPAAEARRRNLLLHDADGMPIDGYVWPGKVVFPDFARAETQRWWGDQLHVLTEPGVDGLWCDMNEPAIVDRPYDEPGVTQWPVPLAAVEGDTVHGEQHNLYGARMAEATYTGLLRVRPRQRAWVLTRSAFTGSQRHAVSWTGDNRSRWEDLALSLGQIASLGLSGMPHVGADIGGFYEDVHAELLARWFELGSFYPYMRCHTARGTRAQEPWSFGPEVENLARRAIALRYRLLPYLYTLAHRAHRHGEPLLRPMFYDYPDDPRSYAVDDQFMLGRLLLVAPITKPRQRRRLVELPAGDWYDFWSGERLRGGQAVIREGPLGRPPLLVRGSALLTLGSGRANSREPLAELTIAGWPGSAPGRWTLVEDDGESFEYREGVIAERDLSLEADGRRVRLTVAPQRGAFAPEPRRLRLRLHLPRRPAAAWADGRRVQDWHWDGRLHAADRVFDDDGLAHEFSVDLSVSWHLQP